MLLQNDLSLLLLLFHASGEKEHSFMDLGTLAQCPVELRMQQVV